MTPQTNPAPFLAAGFLFTRIIVLWGNIVPHCGGCYGVWKEEKRQEEKVMSATTTTGGLCADCPNPTACKAAGVCLKRIKKSK
jgi:hypothetical protein